ncbi:MAG: NAD(P)-dependent alcohol dehydrogenase [Rhodospirillaceae bacterium]|nr:NAD(P)-dependent alcohol dehydrogenase [Rhodospirillaceae bacterium]MBT5241522.1 NAD(P)-dependent alcohol dehydrogenase [Rhodospirillaceae bacterium]MBT5566208.1 NAD(P)-dependent alcohol dehydrogenase [Rhodospirillaceae bacterium]MBT6088926.1 NAD(P)-dependent alcohol dehydrogenase [Rhodospirillaceae bacterium]MBT6961464.1 NAD(P)-dependent alcohol dehydrogenase [Rhodospirillaceae bacterium]
MVSRRNALTAVAGATGALVSGRAALGRPGNQLAQSEAGTYRAFEIGEQKGPETLRLVERPIDPPNPGQVMIRVTATSINARDHGLISNRFPIPRGRRPGDRIPISEGAGVVLEVGAGVTQVQPGDRVTATHFSSWVKGPWDPEQSYIGDVGNNIDGWLSEIAYLPAQALVKLPEGVSEETAATFVSSGVTAWHALYEVARVKPGDVVLSLGTGGVSSFGVQLAKASGAKVVVTSSSDKKLEDMKEHGADIGINYRSNPNWGQAVMDATDGHGADIVLENVGRRTLDQSLMGTAVNGYVVMIGTERLPEQLPKMPGFYMKNITMKAISNASVEMLSDMVQAYAVNGLKPVITKRFKFEDAADAFRYQREHDGIGKVIIEHS